MLFVSSLGSPALASRSGWRDIRITAGRVAFSYLGDIWTANEDGTGVLRITDNSAVYPRFRRTAAG
jgi:hypothetical protein